ncbi:HAD family hydrolase [Flavimaricola marinus]|uniref:Phosphorylated carbohydrates phosphatase n=1 Tax=Flavimaricola marinus TaxID=1819565 RepID=A0A238LB14_9RHOB|nr:HAD family phosphatase [Flavimaricola marinus]SMY06791.1 Phosphorylated carbohydrates phosphatase [Flavimaricola marinus]
MTEIRAVIFDMDGTLIDSERLMIGCAMVALRQLGHPEREDVLVSMVGIVNDECDAILREAFGPSMDLAEFHGVWRGHVLDAYSKGIPLRPGARDLLDHLSDKGTPIAVATNSKTEPAKTHLKTAGIDHYFGHPRILGRDLVATPKPAPDLFLHAAEVLDTDPAHCLVFEDSDAGTVGARAAGMHVVQIPDMKPAGTDHAHLITDSLLSGARHYGIL